MPGSNDLRKNYLVSTADVALVAAGTAVFSCPVGSNGTSLTNIQDGQYAVVDPDTGLAVDHTNISGYANIERLIIGVGRNTKRSGGMANVFLRAAGESSFACGIDYIRNKAPRCGTPHIKDFFYKCIQSNTTYSLKFSWEDYITRSHEPHNRDPHITASYKMPGAECDECSVTANCGVLGCGLIEDFKQDLSSVDWDWKEGIGNQAPLELVKLYGGGQTSKTWCMSPQDSTCTDCNYVTAILKFTFQGTTTTLTNNTNPDDAGETLIDQLDEVVNQINAVLEVNREGKAVIQHGVGKCCEYQIHVNSCDPAFQLLTTADAVIAPCTNVDPATTVNLPITCGSCETPVAASGTVTLATALAGDTVTINGLVYTAVSGAKANNTEFDIDGSDTVDALDLVDSINNDNRVGTLHDVSAASALGVVTLTQTVAGTVGNATTLVSSDGGTLAVSGAVFTGGLYESTAAVWSCGVRAIVHPVIVECGVYGPNPLPIYFGRSVNIEAVGDGWAPGSTYSVDYQSMTLPENFGVFIWEQEYRSSNGGAGRRHDEWNTLRGPKRAHDRNDRTSFPVADCDQSYCTWDIGHSLAHNVGSINGNISSVPVVTTFAIPENFTVAKGAFESFLSSYIAELGPKCPAVSSVNCSDAYSFNGYRV